MKILHITYTILLTAMFWLPVSALAEEGSFADALAKEQGTASRPAPLQPQGNEAPGSARAVVPQAQLAIDKAEGENALRVAEIFAQAKALNGKTVRVRGKVMKNSRMIMARNWLHLQDGTGDATKQEHDLVVTTTDEAQEGAIVTVTGVVAADKDFGAGYRYRVLLENAKVEL